jgi:uridine kinase
MPTGLDGNPDPIRTPARDALLRTIAREVLGVRPDKRTCVGIDGQAGAGKSTFADELAQRLEAAGRPVVRSTTDSFHNPRAVRYRRGRTSAEGYYRDSHDLGSIRELLMDPFLAGTAIRVAVFDETSDRPVDVSPQLPPKAAVLVFDGLFIHRPELRRYWDYSIYLMRRRESHRPPILSSVGSLRGMSAAGGSTWMSVIPRPWPPEASTTATGPRRPSGRPDRVTGRRVGGRTRPRRALARPTRFD